MLAKDILLLTGISFSVYGSGAILVRRFPYISSPLESMVLSVGLGFGMIAYLMFATGLFLLWSNATAYVILCPGLVYGVWRLAQWSKVNLHQLKLPKKRFQSSFILIVSTILLCHLIINFLSNFAPPLNGDTLGIYLYCPKLWVESQGVTSLTDHPWSYMPATGMMLSSLGLLLSGDSLPQLLVGFIPGLLCTLTIYAIARRRFSSDISLLGAAIFYCTPVVIWLNYSTKVDLLAAFYELLAILCFLNFYDSDKQAKSCFSCILLSGILCGLALGTKYLSFAPVLLGVAFLFLFVINRDQWGGRHKKVLLSFFLVTGIVASPWYIKNLIFTGNPFFPLFATEGSVAQLFVRDRVYGGLLGFFLLPWLWSVKVSLPNAHPVGPAFALGLPLLVFLKGIDGYIKTFLYFAIGSLILCFATVCYPRNMLGAIGLLSICISYATLRTADGKRFLKYGLFSILIVMLTFNLSLELWRNLLRSPKVPYIIGHISREEFLQHSLTENNALTYPMMQFINNKVPPDSRILTIGPFHPYYVDRAIVGGWDCILLGDENEAEEYLKKKGATHVFFNPLPKKSKFGKAFLNCPLFSENFRKKHFSLVFENNGKYLFEFIPESKLR